MPQASMRRRASSGPMNRSRELPGLEGPRRDEDGGAHAMSPRASFMRAISASARALLPSLELVSLMRLLLSRSGDPRPSSRISEARGAVSPALTAVS
jgi:hypothetical protein